MTAPECIEALKRLHNIGNGSEKKNPKGNSKAVNFDRLDNVTRQLGDSADPQTSDTRGLGQDAVHVLPSADIQDSLEQLPTAQSRKDMRSFTQRLFDTESFDVLHTVSVLTESSDRIPWLCVEPEEYEDALQGRELGGVSTFIKGAERMAKPPAESANAVLESAVLVSEPDPIESPSPQVAFGNSDPSMIRVQTPECLSYFTLGKIEAIKEAITEHGFRGFFDDQDFLRRLGRPSTSMKLAAFEDGSVNEGERMLTFATQSIVHVLGSVNNLLSSFRDPPYAWGDAYNEFTSKISGEPPSALRTLLSLSSFAKTSAAFFQLKQVDSHPANILPSLRMSLRKIERSRFTYHYPMYSLNAPGLRGSVCEGRKVPESLDLADILHLVNTILAALVAFVPLCDPFEWAAIQKYRAEGRVVTSNYSRDINPWSDKLNRRIIDLIDALEDDMLLSLTRQLIRVVLSHYRRSRWASKHIEPDNEREEATFGIDKNLFDSWMEHRAVDNENNVATHDRHNSPMFGRIHSYFTVLELLRTVMLKEWNGKAHIPKHGLVAGAAGCLQALCESIVRPLSLQADYLRRSKCGKGWVKR